MFVLSSLYRKTNIYDCPACKCVKAGGISMKKIITWIVLFALALALLGCSSAPKEKILIGLQLTPASTLVQVADEKGFFKNNGLDIEIKEFTAGKFAFQAMIAKSVQFSVVGDIPVTLAKMQGNGFYVLSEVGENKNEAPLLIRDDGSKSVADFFAKKRKISTSIGGTPEFSLYLNLKANNIPKEQVEIVAQRPEEMVGALSNGSVDGINIFEPYPSIAEEKMQGKTKRFPLAPQIYTAKYLLAADSDFVNKNPQIAQKMLKSLKEAQDFVQSHPQEAQEIVAKRTKFDRLIISKIWGDFDFKARLSGQLSKTLEMERDWAIETGKVKDGAATDFSSLMWQAS